MATKKSVPAKLRKVKAPRYKSFRLSKRIKHPQKLPSSWQLVKEAFAILRTNKRFFITIMVVYGLFSYVLVKSIAGGLDIVGLQDTLEQVSGNRNEFLNTVALFGILVGGNTQTASDAAGIYQIILIVVTSLALIFGLRHMYNDDDRPTKKVFAKQAFYKGMTPLIPFLLVIVVIGLQLIPFTVGSSIYAIVVNTGLAVTSIEKVFWVLFVALLGILSLYMITSSVFAMYAVTLPNMTPMRALRATRNLVRHRRWTVLRKLFVIPLVFLLLLAAVTLPIIAYVPALAEFVFFIITLAVLPLLHAYVYNFYRKLL